MPRGVDRKPMCKQLGCFLRGGYILVTPFQGLDWQAANKDYYCLTHVRKLYWDGVNKAIDEVIRAQYMVYKIEEWPVTRTWKVLKGGKHG